MRIRTANNENSDLSMYNQRYITMSGALDMFTNLNISETQFNVLAGRLYTYIFNGLSMAERGVMLMGGTSYTANMLRDYMKDVQITRQPYTPDKRDTYWVPLFEKYGYTAKVAKLFFDEFYRIKNTGAVPNDVWYPPVKSVPGTLHTPSVPTGGAPAPEKSNTGLIIAAVGVMAAGVAGYFIMSK